MFTSPVYMLSFTDSIYDEILGIFDDETKAFIGLEQDHFMRFTDDDLEVVYRKKADTYVVQDKKGLVWGTYQIEPYLVNKLEKGDYV